MLSEGHTQLPYHMLRFTRSLKSDWNSCTGNKLQAMRPTVGGHQQKSSLPRRDEVVIGHTRCTHSYLLSGADQPECTTCQCHLDVKNILVECTDFNDIRTEYFVTSSLEELFRSVDVRNVLDFIKESKRPRFYNKL